jgi:hypothetical protein
LNEEKQMSIDPAVLSKFSLGDREVLNRVLKRVDQVNAWSANDMKSSITWSVDFTSFDRDFSKASDHVASLLDTDMTDLVYFFAELKKDPLSAPVVEQFKALELRHDAALAPNTYRASIAGERITVSGSYAGGSINGSRTGALRKALREQL